MSIQITLPNDTLTFNANDIANYTEVLSLKPGGIYALRNKLGECIYVGKSKLLRHRLGSHIRSSPFASEIFNITLYFCDTESSRDIYETYAIKQFAPLYNKSKVDRPNRPLRIYREMVEDLSEELRMLKVRRGDVATELRELPTCYCKVGKVRHDNPYTGEESEAWRAHIAYVQIWEEERGAEYREEKQRLSDELREIDDEISEIKDKIRKYKEKLVS